MKDDSMTNKMVERVARSFESQSMMKTLGARIHKVEKGKVTIEAPLLTSTLQQQGYVHAGLTFSIGQFRRIFCTYSDAGGPGSHDSRNQN